MLIKLLLILFLIFLFVPSVSAFHKLKGEFIAEKECPAWQSFRKQKNSDNLKIKPRQTYPLVGENKVGGDWVQVRLPQGLYWVSKQCGSVTVSQTAKADFYTLALTWQPSFCTMKNDRQLPECKILIGGFVLHGLWPSVKKGSQPAFCQGDKKLPACGYPPLELTEKQLGELQEVMPGVLSCRQRYQWYKHGTCTGMKTSDYYKQAVTATKWFRSSSVTTQFVGHSGKKVNKKQVLRWFENLKATESVTLHCQHAKDGSEELTEVRLYLDYDTTNFPHLIKAPLSHSCSGQFYISK